MDSFSRWLIVSFLTSSLEVMSLITAACWLQEENRCVYLFVLLLKIKTY